MKIGLAGCGTGGRHFHAPFMAEGVELTGVVARAPATIAAVRSDLPGVPIYPSRHDRGRRNRRRHKFAPDASGVREFDEAARAKGIILGVYQNRRWDSDIQTLRKLIGDDRLGRIWRVHSRMDFDSPSTLEAGPTGRLLRDLGSHLVQMLWLLGPVTIVDAQLDGVDLPEGRARTRASRLRSNTLAARTATSPRPSSTS